MNENYLAGMKFVSIPTVWRQVFIFAGSFQENIIKQLK
jgi:hypothetical protein